MAVLPFDVVVRDDGSVTVKRFADNTDRAMKRVGDAGVRGSRRLSNAFRRMNIATKGARGSFGNLFRVATSLKTLFFGGLAAAFVIKGFKSLTSAASIQEAALSKLNAQLITSGEFSEAVSKDLQDFASNLQKITLFGDETTLSMLALAQSFGFSAEQSKVAVEAAANLSVAAGIELTEAVRRVGRSISGSTADVSKFAIGIKNLTKEELRAGKAADVLLKSLGGAAAAQVRTFTGRVTQLGNAAGDLRETFGDAIIKSNEFRDAIGEMTLGFTAAQTALAKVDLTGLGDSFTTFLPTAEGMISSIFFITRSMIRLQKALEFVKLGFEGIIAVATLNIKALNDNFNRIDKLERALKRLEGAEQDAKIELGKLREEMIASSQAAKELEKNSGGIRDVLDEVAKATNAVSGEFGKILTPQERFAERLVKSKEEAKELQLSVNRLREEIGEKPLPIVKGFFNIPALLAEQDRVSNIIVKGIEEDQAIQRELKAGFSIQTEIDFEAEAEKEIDRRKRLRGLLLEGEELFLSKVRKFEAEQTQIKFQNSAARLDIATRFLAAGNTLAQTFGSKNVEIQKGIAIAQATVATAAAVMNALASSIPPNLALAAAVAAVGAAQIAAIAAARPGGGAAVPPGGEQGGQLDIGGGVERLREIPIEAVRPGPMEIIINVTGFIGDENELASELGRVFREAVGDDVDFGLQTNVR